MSLEVIERAIEAQGEEIKKFGTEQRSAIEKTAEEVKSLEDRVGKIEAKGSRKNWSESTKADSPGHLFLKSDHAKAFLKGQMQSSGRIEVKNIITGLPSGSPQEQFPVRPDRARDIYGFGFEPLGLTDILPSIRVSSNTYEYTQLRNFTGNAAVQAGEGAAKAQSSMTFDLKRSEIVTVAHYVKASKQVLADAPQLEAYINRLMTFDLSLTLEDKFLNDTGADGITGFLQTVDSYNGPQSRMVDDLAYAIATIQARGWRPNGVVMSPIRWAFFRTLTDSEDRYLSGGFSMPMQPSLWGLPVIVSSKIADNQILVGDFANGAQMLMREEANVMVGYENDDFTRNLVTILAEVRASLAITVPAAFLKLTAGSPDL